MDKKEIIDTLKRVMDDIDVMLYYFECDGNLQGVYDFAGKRVGDFFGCYSDTAEELSDCVKALCSGEHSKKTMLEFIREE